MQVDEEMQKRVEVIRKSDKVDDPRIKEALSGADPADLGERLARLLLSDSFEPEKAGLLVDWLSAVELEIVNLKQGEKNVQVRGLQAR